MVGGSGGLTRAVRGESEKNRLFPVELKPKCKFSGGGWRERDRGDDMTEEQELLKGFVRMWGRNAVRTRL
jgi:hypothetical protein